MVSVIYFQDPVPRVLWLFSYILLTVEALCMLVLASTLRQWYTCCRQTSQGCLQLHTGQHTLLHSVAYWHSMHDTYTAGTALQAFMTPRESTWNRKHQKQSKFSNSTFALIYMVWGLDSLVLNRIVANFCHSNRRAIWQQIWHASPLYC